MDTSALRVAAVIATHNRARLLPRAIDSVLGQTHCVSEVIVVDDASTDHTHDVVARYGGRVKYIYQPGLGCAGARNAGAKTTSCEWIAFLDDDDEWLPEKTAKQLAAIHACPGAVLCYGGATAVNCEGSETFIASVPPDRIWPGLRLSNISPPSTYMMRRDVFMELGGFNEKLRVAEDWELLARMAYGRPVAAVWDEPVLRYYEHPNSISRDGNVMLAAELGMVDGLLIGLSGISRFFWRQRIVSRMYLRAAIAARISGADCRRYLLRSLLCWPSPLFESRRFKALALEFLPHGAARS